MPKPAALGDLRSLRHRLPRIVLQVDVWTPPLADPEDLHHSTCHSCHLRFILCFYFLYLYYFQCFYYFIELLTEAVSGPLPRVAPRPRPHHPRVPLPSPPLTPPALFQVLALESLHTVGLTTLVFAVLPHFGSLYALALLTSVGLLPAVAKLFFSRYRHVSSSGRAVLLTTADLLAVIAQVAAVVYPVSASPPPPPSLSSPLRSRLGSFQSSTILYI